MSQSPPPKMRAYYPLIPHPTTARVLLVEGGAGWEPPCLPSTDWNVFAGGPLAAWVKEQLALEVTQLRVVEGHIDPADRRWDWALIAMENHGASSTPPPGARWVSRAELAGLPPAHPEHLQAIDGWLAELETGDAPATRPPWARPGWWDEIGAWVADSLAAQGLTLQGPLEQRKVWGISCLLRGQTDGGAVYVKGCATLPLFANEAAITAELAARFPAHIPTPLAANRERRWMMLADFGGEMLSEAPRAAWDATMDAYAALQKASVSQVESLLAAGCLDRGLDHLASAIPTLPEGVQKYSSLDAEQVAAFAELLPRLEAACGELAAAGIPPALVHSDLHENNIAIVDGQPLFFDWSDACIAHPFFDLATLMFTEYFAAHPDERLILRDRYLSHWTDYAPLDELRRLAELAIQLGNLHQIVSYIGIVSNLEPSMRWENTGGYWWVEQLLRQDGQPEH